MLDISPSNCDRDFAIVLAAGKSSRMGACKAGLQWRNGQTMLVYQTTQLLLAKIVPIVVLGPHNIYQREDCPSGCWIVVNPEPDRGKTSSILTGLQALPKNFRNVIISAVDQPRSKVIYQTLIQAHQHHDAAISVPIYKGRTGHPTVFSRAMLPNLMTIREEAQGIRQIVQQFSVCIQKVEFRTINVLTDLNTPEVYQIQQLENKDEDAELYLS